MIKTLYLVIFILSTTISQSQVSELQINHIEPDAIEINKETSETTGCYTIYSRFPVYPGCEKLQSYSTQKKCFANKIFLFVTSAFNKKMISNKNLPQGKIRIQTLFYIDTNGKPTKISVKAPTLELEKEAIRVISLLPKMKPALQRDRPVEYPVSIPIIIENKWK